MHDDDDDDDGDDDDIRSGLVQTWLQVRQVRQLT